MVAPIGSRPPAAPRTTTQPATSQAKSAATAATGHSSSSGFSGSTDAATQAAKDFQTFLGEAAGSKGDGSSYVKMFGGSDSDVSRNVKTATDDFSKWLAANPKATAEQVKGAVDKIKSSMGSHIMSDKNFENYLMSSLLSAMKHVSLGGDE